MGLYLDYQCAISFLYQCPTSQSKPASVLHPQLLHYLNSRNYTQSKNRSIPIPIYVVFDRRRSARFPFSQILILPNQSIFQNERFWQPYSLAIITSSSNSLPVASIGHQIPPAPHPPLLSRKAMERSSCSFLRERVICQFLQA